MEDWWNIPELQVPLLIQKSFFYMEVLVFVGKLIFRIHRNKIQLAVLSA